MISHRPSDDAAMNQSTHHLINIKQRWISCGSPDTFERVQDYMRRRIRKRIQDRVDEDVWTHAERRVWLPIYKRVVWDRARDRVNEEFPS